jgi:pilus assembly protein Flp/PilA
MCGALALRIRTEPADDCGVPTRIRRDLRREDGASAVEYGLLIVAVAAVIVGVVVLFGTGVRGLFSKTQSCISKSTSSTC